MMRFVAAVVPVAQSRLVRRIAAADQPGNSGSEERFDRQRSSGLESG